MNNNKFHKCIISKLQYQALDSLPQVVSSMGFEFQHEFKAKMRSTTAFTTSRPLLPLILVIDRAKTSKISPLPGLVHSLRETNTVLRRYFKDWPGDFKMNQWQIPWEEREI